MLLNSSFQTPEEEFDEHFMMLTNACMHLIDTNFDMEALKQIRYAQRRMIMEKRIEKVEEVLDGKATLATATGFNWYASSTPYFTPSPTNASTVTYPITAVSSVSTASVPTFTVSKTLKLRVPKSY